MKAYYVDHLISMLQVYGYSITISNDRIGNLHTCRIYQYQKNKKAFFKKVLLSSHTYYLPEQYDSLIQYLKVMGSIDDIKFITYKEWLQEINQGESNE